jgi:hypothetical protein
LDEWQKLKKDFDYLPVNSSSIMTVQPGMFEFEDDCKYSCTGSTCVFYQYSHLSKTCAVYLAPEGSAADPIMTFAMKIDEGVYAVYRTNAAAKAIGTVLPVTESRSLVTSVVTSSVSACVKLCDELEVCVGLFVTKASAVLDGTSDSNSGTVSCELRSGSLSAEYSSKYRIADGSNINRWQ